MFFAFCCLGGCSRSASISWPPSINLDVLNPLQDKWKSWYWNTKNTFMHSYMNDSVQIMHNFIVLFFWTRAVHGKFNIWVCMHASREDAADSQLHWHVCSRYKNISKFKNVLQTIFSKKWFFSSFSSTSLSFWHSKPYVGLVRIHEDKMIW